MGDYYNRNKAQSFTEQVQSDPNDPNSMTERIKSYAEVSEEISVGLLKNKINSKTEKILYEAQSKGYSLIQRETVNGGFRLVLRKIA